MHEGKPITCSIGKVFKKCLNTSCLPKKHYNKEQKPIESDKKTDSENKTPEVDEQLLWKDVKECIDELLEKVEQQEEKKPSEEAATVISLSDSDEDKKRKE